MDLIPVYKPYLTKDNTRFAHEAIDSGWISSNDHGKYKELCEEFLKQYLGVKYVLLTSNGTTALHLVAKALKHLKPAVTNVYVPSSAYVAAWNMFDEFNLIPLDSDEHTWNADFSTVKDDESNAILVVHNIGNPVNVPELKRRFPKCTILEDACEAFGGMYEGYKTGSQSLASVFSFYGNKTITSGEGGALVTNDKDVYEFCKLLHGQGQSNKKFIHSTLGYNYRMTNVQAALLYGQLQDVGEIFTKKKAIWAAYDKAFSSNRRILLQKVDDNCTPSYWLYGIRLLNEKDYETLRFSFIFESIETRPMFYPINHHGHYSHIQEKFVVSERLAKECAILPSYPEMTTEEIERVVEKVLLYAKTQANMFL